MGFPGTTSFQTKPFSEYDDLKIIMFRPYIDKSEYDFLRTVVGCQHIPDGEEVPQRWSRVGARQDNLYSFGKVVSENF